MAEKGKTRREFLKSAAGAGIALGLAEHLRGQARKESQSDEKLRREMEEGRKAAEKFIGGECREAQELNNREEEGYRAYLRARGGEEKFKIGAHLKADAVLLNLKMEALADYEKRRVEQIESLVLHKANVPWEERDTERGKQALGNSGFTPFLIKRLAQDALEEIRKTLIPRRQALKKLGIDLDAEKLTEEEFKEGPAALPKRPILP